MMTEELAVTPAAWTTHIAGNESFASTSAMAGDLSPSSSMDSLRPPPDTGDHGEEASSFSATDAAGLLLSSGGCLDDGQSARASEPQPPEPSPAADSHAEVDAAVEERRREEEQEREEEEVVNEEDEVVTVDRADDGCEVVVADGDAEEGDGVQEEATGVEEVEQASGEEAHEQQPSADTDDQQPQPLPAALEVPLTGLSPSSSPASTSSASSSPSGSAADESYAMVPATPSPYSLGASDATNPPAELQCSVCLDPFTRPVALPCSHTFCAECLRRHSQEFAQTLERMAKAGLRSYGLSDAELQLLQNENPSSDERSSFLLATRCSVCYGKEESNDPIVSCTGCGLKVHESCYGELDDSGGEDQWLCEPCRLNAPTSLRRCVLCSNTDDRAYKQTTGLTPDGTKSTYHPTLLTSLTRFVHVSCAFHHPPPTFAEGVNEWNSPVVNTAMVDRRRFSLRCLYCNSVPSAACLQCNYAKCTRAYCVPCGLRHGVKFETRLDPEVDDEEDSAQHFSFCTVHRKYSDIIKLPNQPPVRTKRKPKRRVCTRCPVCRDWASVSLVHRSLLLPRRYDLSKRVQLFRAQHQLQMPEEGEESEEEPSRETEKRRPTKPLPKLSGPAETIARTRQRRSNAGTHHRQSPSPSFIYSPAASPAPAPSPPSRPSSPLPLASQPLASQPNRRPRKVGKQKPGREAADVTDPDEVDFEPPSFPPLSHTSPQPRRWSSHCSGQRQPKTDRKARPGGSDQAVGDMQLLDDAADEEGAEDEDGGEGESDEVEAAQGPAFLEMDELELEESAHLRDRALHRPYIQKLLSSLVRERDQWTVDAIQAELSRDDLLSLFQVHGFKRNRKRQLTKQQCATALLYWVRQGKVREAPTLQETIALTSAWQQPDTIAEHAEDDEDYGAGEEHERDEGRAASAHSAADQADQDGAMPMDEADEAAQELPPPDRAAPRPRQPPLRGRRRKRKFSSASKRIAAKLISSKRARAEVIGKADERGKREDAPMRQGEGVEPDHEAVGQVDSLSAPAAEVVEPSDTLPLLPRIFDLTEDSDDEEAPHSHQLLPQSQQQTLPKLLHSTSSSSLASSPSTAQQRSTAAASTPALRSSSFPLAPPALLPSAAVASPLPFSSTSHSSASAQSVRQSSRAVAALTAALQQLTEGHLQAIQRDCGWERGEIEAARIVGSIPSVIGEVRASFVALHELLYRVEAAMIAERVTADMEGLGRGRESIDSDSLRVKAEGARV